METFVQDVRFGGRMLLKNKSFTLVAIAALALGIGASTAIFSLIDAVLLRPLPYPHPERVVVLEGINPARGITDSNVSALDVLDWKARSDVFEHLALYFTAGAVLAAENGEPVRVPRAGVQWEFFTAVGVQPLLGRAFGPAQDRASAEPAALLGNNLWRRHFGADRNIIGRQLTINGRLTTVLGVMPPGFNFPNGETEIWTAMRLDPAEEVRSNRSLQAIGRLKPNATIEQAQTQLTPRQLQTLR